MKPEVKHSVNRREGGQTIIVAMIILGVLLIIGFVFIGIVDRNIITSSHLQTRSATQDMAEAGIRYAHSQLLDSELGADWGGTPTVIQPTATGSNFTLDPDAFYLRPATGLQYSSSSPQFDLGGPDGLGPFFRVNFGNGRALVRVRYAPSDANIFNSSPTGPLRNPGLVRNYIMIESVGRPGKFSSTDPTTLTSTTPVQYRGFGNTATLQAALSRMGANEGTFYTRNISRAFASIGIIESARYITNENNVTRPAEIGIPSYLGAVYNGTPVATGGGTTAPLSQQLGTSLPLFTIAAQPTAAPGTYPGSGSIYSNADLKYYGNNLINLNPTLGDLIAVAGSIEPADASSRLQLLTTLWNGVTWSGPSGIQQQQAVNGQTVAGITFQPDSRSSFDTDRGAVRDAMGGFDLNGFPRGISRKEPPSISQRNPQTGENRYLVLTRDSGLQVNGGNDGRWGFGTGVYVNNLSDVQVPEDEAGRIAAGTSTSLPYDWLNPDNGQTNSGWHGPYYIPVGAFVELNEDGFTIFRDAAGPDTQRTWKNMDGSDTGSAISRFRLGLGSDNRVHVVNTFTPFASGRTINSSLGVQDFDLGPVFSGVLYFEGNARVRGTIPTDIQLTLVSNSSIYIEGSITKGVLGNGLQPGTAFGARLTRPSRSMLMLMARDYVTLNTTMFFGPSPSQSLEVVNDQPNGAAYNPVRVRTGESLDLLADFALDPSANPLNPSVWVPYNAEYSEFATPANKIPSNWYITHTMDDGPASAAFITGNWNFGAFDNGTSPPNSQYYFPAIISNLAASAPSQFAPNTVPIYGIGGEAYQRYPKFESIMFPLIDPATVNISDPRYMVANSNIGKYTLLSDGGNDLLLKPAQYNSIPTNDYLVAKTLIVPHDIRVEASVFAQNGSFFVIPGTWANPDPNDTRANYASLGATPAERRQRRIDDFGAYPGVPFYGEPADVRVTIVGAVSENMPPPMDQQAQWLQKYGWIPRDLGATGNLIPGQHVPPGFDLAVDQWVPNLTYVYDSELATARTGGFVNDNSLTTLLRVDDYGRPLPPLPRLPVSPKLAYFGEEE